LLTKWHDDQKMDEAGLNECIIKDAARLIASEIRNMPYNTDQYPSPSDMLDASVPDVPPLGLSVLALYCKQIHALMLVM